MDQVKGRLVAGHICPVILAGIFLALLWELYKSGVVDDYDVGIGDKERVDDGCEDGNGTLDGDGVPPECFVWSKKNDDIEPLSKNEFFFQYPLKSMSYDEKKNGQTVISDDLSALAPQVGLEPTTP